MVSLQLLRRNGVLTGQTLEFSCSRSTEELIARGGGSVPLRAVETLVQVSGQYEWRARVTCPQLGPHTLLTRQLFAKSRPGRNTLTAQTGLVHVRENNSVH